MRVKRGLDAAQCDSRCPHNVAGFKSRPCEAHEHRRLADDAGWKQFKTPYLEILKHA